MKKFAIILLLLLCLPALLCSNVPVKYVRMTDHGRNAALLSKIMLERFGEKTYIKLLYLQRDKKSKGRFIIKLRTVMDSTFHYAGEAMPFNEYYDSLYCAVLGCNDYLSVIDTGIRTCNDTLYYVDPNDETPDLSYYLTLMESGRNLMLMLLMPNNISKKCIDDSTAWEQEAIRSVREQISKVKRYTPLYIELRAPLPDSLKERYEIYNR